MDENAQKITGRFARVALPSIAAVETALRAAMNKPKGILVIPDHTFKDLFITLNFHHGHDPEITQAVTLNGSLLEEAKREGLVTALGMYDILVGEKSLPVPTAI
jgi:hypothetical protein